MPCWAKVECRSGGRAGRRLAGGPGRGTRRRAGSGRCFRCVDPRYCARMSPRIGLVAGEPSGDLLAARIMQGLALRPGGVHCEGIGGPAMQREGLDMWHSMHALTVFGYVDAFKRLPGLLSTYFDVKKRWLAARPQVFVGIDAPDFNLRLEHSLKQRGIPTVHFVGPSIWA